MKIRANHYPFFIQPEQENNKKPPEINTMLFFITYVRGEFGAWGIKFMLREYRVLTVSNSKAVKNTSNFKPPLIPQLLFLLLSHPVALSAESTNFFPSGQ